MKSATAVFKKICYVFCVAWAFGKDFAAREMIPVMGAWTASGDEKVGLKRRLVGCIPLF